MPLVPSISVSQSGLLPTSVTVEDTSTGSDVAITSRRIYFQTNQGTYLVVSGTTTDYEIWPIANVSQTWNVLPTDHALNIVINWLDVNGTVLYTLNGLYCLRQNNQNFLVYLGQLQAITPGILQDPIYAGNIATYWAYVQYAYTMVTIGGDISNSQNLLDKATYMMQKEALFF